MRGARNWERSGQDCDAKGKSTFCFKRLFDPWLREDDEADRRWVSASSFNMEDPPKVSRTSEGRT